MNDSTRCDLVRREECGSCGRWEFVFSRFLSSLDRRLYNWMRDMEERELGGRYLRSLYCLQEIIDEVDRTALKHGCPVEHMGKSQIIGSTLCVDEQRLRENSSGTHAPPSSEGVKAGSINAGLPATTKDRAAQTRAATLVSVAVGGSPTGTADAGVQASRGPGDPPTRRRKRRRDKSRAQCSAPASPSSDSVTKRTGGGDTSAAGPSKDGGCGQGNTRGDGAKAPPRPPACGPSFAAVVASAGESRPSPLGAATAGGACGRGDGKVRAPVDGGVMRVSPSSSPPPPRPEPKQKKGGPPPSAAVRMAEPSVPAGPARVRAAGPGAFRDEGMRRLVSSIPVKNLRVGDRDVTVNKFLSAVSLLAECAAGVLLLGHPARGAAASPPSIPSPEESGSTDGGLAGRDTRYGKDGRRGSARRSPSGPPPVGGGPKVCCWGCGAAGHLLRGCPDFRGYCRRVRGARAAGGCAVPPGASGRGATHPRGPGVAKAPPRAETVRAGRDAGPSSPVAADKPGLRPHQPPRGSGRPTQGAGTGAGEPTPAPKGAIRQKPQECRIAPAVEAIAPMCVNK